MAYQKSPSVSEPGDARPASIRPSATRRAPVQVWAAASGDQRAVSAVGRRRGVVDPHLPLPSAPGQGVADEVTFDRGGQHRPLPFEQGRNGQSGCLETLGRSHHQQRMTGVGRHQSSAGDTEGETAGHRRRHDQRTEVAPTGPVRGAVIGLPLIAAAPPAAGRSRGAAAHAAATGAGARVDSQPENRMAAANMKTTAPTSAQLRRGRPLRRPAMRASVSTRVVSKADSRCWTRKERPPTFHRATPRCSCGTSSASVEDSPSRSPARSTSPGGWA